MQSFWMAGKKTFHLIIDVGHKERGLALLLEEQFIHWRVFRCLGGGP